MDASTRAAVLKGPGAGQLHVASVIVHCRPEKLQSLKAWLIEQEGVEIPVSSPEGKLVVVSESDSERAIADLMQMIGDRPGVLNTAMVYHEIIDNEDDSP
ncbi:chaperone NapD [Wenzhouxiangella sp. AB-CW3]|nr:chaperone NapD [Wenzhouxiangella sp. AB-CW3]